MHSGTNSKRVKKKISVSISKSKVNLYEKNRILSGADKPKNKDENNIKETAEEWSFNQNKQDNSSITSLEEKELKVDNYKANDPVSPMPSNKDIDPREILKIYGTLPDVTGGNMINKTEGFIYMTTPPDGGYAWIILFSAFFSGLINDGNILSMGTILPSIERDLNVHASATAFIAAIQMTMYNCIGPVSGAFINKVGFRLVAITGLVCASFGLIVGAFCTDIISLTVFFGLFYGSGVGMGVMTNQLIVAYYFEKYRAIAVGAQTASAGIGLLVYGPLNTYFIKIYGWSLTLLMMAVSFLCCSLFCITFKKIEPKKIGRIVEVLPTEEDSVESIEVELTRFSVFLDEEIKVQESVTKVPETQNTTNIDKTPSNFGSKDMKKSSSVAATSPSTNTGENEKKIVIDIDPLERVDIFSPTNADYDKVDSKLGKNTQVMPGKEQEAKEINYRLSMSRLITPESKKSETIDKCCQLNKKIEDGFHMLFDMKLFKSWEFGVLQVAFLLFAMGVIIPFLFVVRRSEIPLEYSNWMLSWIGLLNVFLRFCLGFIAFYTKEKTIYLLAGCILTGGLGIWISCFIPHNIVWLEFFYCAIFAFSHASFFSLRAIVIINILGIEKLTNAFGLLSLCVGFASLIGVNVAGTMITDSNFEPAFMFCGTTILISGLIFVFTPKIIGFIRKMRNLDAEKDTRKVRFEQKL